MLVFHRATATAVVVALALVVELASAAGAACQEPAKDLPVSLDRIRKELTTPPPRVTRDVSLEAPVATFRTQVERRVYPLSLEEWLDKEFNLTELQRQSADWASKCCGIGLGPLFQSVENALERRKIRKIREQIARELAELEAARKKASELRYP